MVVGERRGAGLVSLADTAVVVMAGCDPGALRLLELVKAKGLPVQLVGGGERSAHVKPTAVSPEPETRRGLPD